MESDIVSVRVSSPHIPEGSSAELVRRELAAADQRRRLQAADAAFWRAAPVVMAACAGLAAVSRWRGWPALLPLGVLAAAIAVLLGRAWLARRPRGVTDAVAAAIDETAGLGGELRSAGWFASRDERDSWAGYHLDRAAKRMAAIDWAGLYPSGEARGAKATAAMLAACTLALAIRLPGGKVFWPGAATTAPPAATVRAKGVATPELLLPELQKELEALLAAAETGAPLPAGAPATAAELRSLIARLNALRDAGKLKDLARAMTPPGSGRSDDPARELTALGDRARKAADMPAVAPEVRETLGKVSEEMADAAKTAQPPSDKAGETASSKGTNNPDRSPGKKGGDVDEASIQAVSEAEAGGGAGIIMMGDSDDAAGMASPGTGLGGGSDTRTENGRMAELEAALRRETVEASMDSAGDNVQTEARRKTEHGQATVTYAQSAAGAVDRGRAVAPPPVPESRRAAVQTYFIRKQ